MTRHAHTPGPWNISAHGVPDHIYQSGIYSEDARAIDLAIVKSCEADARLIAAAPDLLAELIRAHEQLEQSTAWRRSPSAQRMRAAIDAATGVSP